MVVVVVHSWELLRSAEVTLRNDAPSDYLNSINPSHRAQALRLAPKGDVAIV